MRIQQQYLCYVSCGLFGIGEDFTEDFQSLDAKFIKNKTSTFFFEAVGDSMIPAVFPRDILIVDRSIKNYDNRVCVICYEGQMLCKRVFITKDGAILKSENKKYKDIVIENSEELTFWGVVISKIGMVK